MKPKDSLKMGGKELPLGEENRNKEFDIPGTE